MKRFAFYMWITLLGSLSNAQTSNGNVVVSYRIDTPPFSQQLADGSFEGLFVQICDEAIARAGFEITKRIPVTAASRFDLSGEVRPDLICDPTTITQNRAANADFSPIIFVANSTFLTKSESVILSDAEIATSEDCMQKRSENPGQNMVGVGMVGDTTANSTYNLALARGLLGHELDFALCTFSFPTHTAGMDALCNGNITHYFGDLDILRAHLLGRDSCRASFRTGFFAYEPYALLLPSSNPMFRKKFVAAVYSLFSDGKAIELYSNTFDKPMSGPLEMLFRINNIPKGVD